MTTKNKKLIVGFILAFLTYLSISFVNVSIDIKTWGEGTRAFCAYFMFCYITIGIVLYSTHK